jgi:histidine triad (HIT) family protein
MASIFTQIIQGKIPSYKIHEDELTISILTIEPVNPGHTLVIPKEEVNHWFDVPESAYLQVHKNAQKIAKAMMKATGCPRIGTIVAGFEVPHFHLHLIPAWSIPDLDFKRARRLPENEMKEIQKKIVQYLG